MRTIRLLRKQELDALSRLQETLLEISSGNHNRLTNGQYDVLLNRLNREVITLTQLNEDN